MAIDKALPDIAGETIDDTDANDDPSVQIERDDDGVTITFGLGNLEPPEFGANLAEYVDEKELNILGSDLLADFDNDVTSRDDWERTYRKGLELLGLKIEERSTPWPGACGVFHPLLAEAAVRFQSQAIMETFPAGGPVKAKNIARSTPDLEKQAQRVVTDMNWFLTEKMTEFRAEHERLLFALPLAGSAFKKVYWDAAFGRPTSMYVAAEDFVVPYGASDLKTAPRYTHVMRKWPNEVRKLQVSGFYRDIDLTTTEADANEVREAKDKLTGEQSHSNDERHTLLEMHVELDLEGFEDEEDGVETGIALPYVVTVDKASGDVLSIYRNWKQDDALKIKRMHFVQYDYIPGFGFYSFGLIHLVGGLAKSATSILRQLVDAGTLSNLPAGLKARGLRIKGDSTPLMPGEFRDVDVPSGTVRDAITFLPYKEPSQVLAALLGTLVEEGRRFASIADLQIGEGNQEAPVGTTLALMERSMKVMSAVQARLHASLHQELVLLGDIIGECMPGPYDYDVGAAINRSDDYNDTVDVIPVSDPNAASLAQRVMQYQAALQLSAQAPQMYDLPELHRQMLGVLGINDIDKIIPDKDDQKPTDPVTENQHILSGKPVKAFQYQDHEAHIAVHMAAIQDPKIMAMVGQSPMAGAIQSAGAAHLNEHIGWQYRREIEKQLGVALPDPEQSLPEDVEVELSKLVADAADRLLKKDQAEQQAQQAQQQAQDPVVQAQMVDAATKKAEVERKAAKDKEDIAAAADQRQIERERIASQERIAGLGQGVKAASDHDKAAIARERMTNDAHTRAFEKGLDLMTQQNKPPPQVPSGSG